MTAPLVFGWGMAGLSMVLVRLGWSRRSWIAPAGWILALGSVLELGRANGAWGIATGTTAAMTVAVVMVLAAAWRSPVRAQRGIRATGSATMPADPLAIGRRLSVFALVVPGAFLAAQWLAFAIQALLRHGGRLDANSLALMLCLQPVIWAVLITWQMTMTGPARMAIPPLAVTALGLATWALA